MCNGIFLGFQLGTLCNDAYKLVVSIGVTLDKVYCILDINIIPLVFELKTIYKIHKD